MKWMQQNDFSQSWTLSDVNGSLIQASSNLLAFMTEAAVCEEYKATLVLISDLKQPSVLSHSFGLLFISVVLVYMDCIQP